MQHNAPHHDYFRGHSCREPGPRRRRPARSCIIVDWPLQTRRARRAKRPLTAAGDIFQGCAIIALLDRAIFVRRKKDRPRMAGNPVTGNARRSVATLQAPGPEGGKAQVVDYDAKGRNVRGATSVVAIALARATGPSVRHCSDGGPIPLPAWQGGRGQLSTGLHARPSLEGHVQRPCAPWCYVRTSGRRRGNPDPQA